jgi:two-component system cell cycle response regulator
MASCVLIIEDHVANLELMSYLLIAFGYTTVAAENGRTGLEMAERERPALILCDIQLPDINGYEIASRLKQDARTHDIPLVAITALAMVGDRERILRAGFDGYISKPIAPETFVSDLERFLRPVERMGNGAPTIIAAAENQEPDARPAMKPQPALNATILVVDNVKANLDLARSIFEPSGYRVLLAGDVETAMQLARETQPDIVLSDVNMPESSGFELLVRVKSDPALERIPVVLISATLPQETRDDLVVAAGATKFLRRPIDPGLLLNEIKSCLDASRRPGQAEARSVSNRQS